MAASNGRCRGDSRSVPAGAAPYARGTRVQPRLAGEAPFR